MKKLLSLAIAGAALAVISVPAEAKPEKEKGAGRGAAARAQGQARVVQQAPRSVQRTQQISPNVGARSMNRQMTASARTETRARDRVGVSGRTVTRTQPSVAFGGQTRTERRYTTDRSDFRRDYRDRNWSRDRDWDGGGVRFRRPPTTVWRDWDHDRIYSWDNHRWHWYDGAWVIVNASPDVYYYDEPIATTYVATSGSTVAAVQRELAREGYDPGPIDGVLGGQTRSAIAAFQRDNGLAATGRIDSALLNELDL